VKKQTLFFSLILIIFLGLSGCNSDTTPELKLKSYIKARFSGGMDKEDVLSYVTGPFYDFVNEMEEADFANFLDLKNLKLNFIKIIDKRCENEKCFVTYLIDYSLMDGAGGKVDFKTQVKKAAELVSIEKDWKIFKIDNLKTLHKANKAIDITN